MKEVINKAYKFRIYPNDEQKVFFAKHFGCVRFVYNHLLATRFNAYKQDGVSMSGFACQNLLPKLKKQAEYAWLKEVNAQSLQGAALNLEKAYKRFFSSSLKSAYPSFKRKGNHESFCVPQHFRVDVQNNQICIPKLKTGIKTVFHRSLKHVEKICSITISITPSEKYYASINVEEAIEHKKPISKLSRSTKTVGIDLGIKDFLVESNGTKINAPKFLRASERQLKKAQR
ncbi:MAG: RNA-guided endonuclease TnpB family protein, partial [Mariprofundaceae bacterium]|nr:RNA-guided endonuclease TnpB family protein [Mariprofundaceae bacterium]